MSVTVNGVTFDYRERGSGEIGDLRTEMLVESRPGLDGHETTNQGTRGIPVIWTLIKYSTTNTNAETFLTSVDALAGTTGTVTDEYGTNFTNVAITDVQTNTKEVVLQAGAVRYRTVSRLTLLKTT